MTNPPIRMTYRETLEFLYGALPVFQQEGASAYKPGLESTLSFAGLLGDPHRKFRAIHVAGTNGKGSVSHMLASVLHHAGYRTGLFTSPHLKDFRERIRVDGEMIPEQEVVNFAARYKEEMVARELTFFEMCTVLAFDWFARQGVEVAVVETGLGGRLDATNILTPLLSVVTNIGLDHTAQLGPTLESIAREKAGIIKPGAPVVVGCRDGATDGVFAARAAETGSELLFAGDRFAVCGVEEFADKQVVTLAAACTGARFDLELDLLGDYQRHNVLTVAAACEQLQGRLDIPHEAIREGCRSVQRTTGLRGRWQVLARRPLTVCDTGHNAHGLREVAAQIARQSYEKLYVVFGVVADKDLASILPLLPAAARYFFTQPSTPRALDCGELARRAAAFGLSGECVPTVGEALGRARAQAGPRDMIFIGGSTFTVADIPEL